VPSKALEALYKRVGSTLFARAQRALKDDQKAREAVESVVIELSRVGTLTDEEALKLGRDLLKKQLEKSGISLDSMSPEKE
jgi:hypothetical protein